jgi:hypothetical protein
MKNLRHQVCKAVWSRIAIISIFGVGLIDAQVDQVQGSFLLCPPVFTECTMGKESLCTSLIDPVCFLTNLILPSYPNVVVV